MSKTDIIERLTELKNQFDRGEFVRLVVKDAIDVIEKLLAEKELEKPPLTLSKLQEEQRPWVEHNFGDRPWQQPLMGISEEVGELNHALLKQWQGIRGTKEKLEREAQDAVGDIVIFLSDLCSSRGWDFQEIIETTWAKVKKRDWKADSQNGGE